VVTYEDYNSFCVTSVFNKKSDDVVCSIYKKIMNIEKHHPANSPLLAGSSRESYPSYLCFTLRAIFFFITIHPFNSQNIDIARNMICKLTSIINYSIELETTTQSASTEA
jgi:hypothetical protein